MTVIILVVMTIFSNGEAREAWRIQKPTTLEVCLTMARVFNHAGKAAASSVTCIPWNDAMPGAWGLTGLTKGQE